MKTLLDTTRAFALLAALLGATAHAGETLYGVTYFGNHLISIDPTTQIGTDVAALNTPMQPFGLASYQNRLYTFDSNADLVRQIDPAEGATVASFDVHLGPVLGQGGLAIRSDGIGFLTSALDPMTLNPVMDLYQFNILAGTSMLVGHTDQTIAALAFSPNDTLYGLGKDDGSLYTVNQSSGALTLVGNVAGAPGSPIESLTFSPTGQLYGTIDDRLYTIDTTTGLGTPVDPDPANDVGFSSISGIAFAATPEPATILAAALGLGLSAITVWSRRPPRATA